jgi:hypothetical protein
MSKLTTLNYMLNHKLAPAGEMANHIETNGIFALDQFGNFKQFGPETHEAKAALAGIAVFLQHETSPPSPEFETWYLEQDPTCHYGWPDGGVPEFGRTDFSYWHQSFDDLTVVGKLFRKDIVTIGRLLLLNLATPGEIGKAVERVGIWGFNQYAEVTPIEMNSSQGVQVHEALREYAKFFINGKLPPNSIFKGNGYKYYGWPDDQLPDFKNLPRAMPAVAAPSPPSLPTATANSTAADDEPKVSPQGAKSFHMVIAALLSVIRGDITPRPHPSWSTQNDLIALLEDKLVKAYGISDGNLREKFAKANKLRPTLGLSAVDEDGNPV